MIIQYLCKYGITYRRRKPSEVLFANKACELKLTSEISNETTHQIKNNNISNDKIKDSK